MRRDVIIITGASGFIGSALLQRLGKDFDVVALDRPGGAPPPDANTVDVDITSDESVTRAIGIIRREYGDRVASVVHLAGYYDFSGEASPKYDAINVQGTARLLTALRSLTVEQFIFASTMLVHRPCDPGSYFNENSPLEPTWAYPRSKLAAEEAVRRERGDIPVVIARIAGVYDEIGHSPMLAHQIRRIYERDVESHLFPGHISHGQAAVHLADLVDFFDTAIRHRAKLPEELTVLVGESEPLNYDELQHLLGRLVHGEDWDTHQIPKPMAKVGAWLKEALPGEEFIKPWMVEHAEDHYALDIRRAREIVGWAPRHQLREALPEIVGALKHDPTRWYRANKLGPPP